MKKLFLLLFLTSSFSLHAQEIQGIVHYKSFVNLEDQIQILNDPATPLNRKKEIESYMQTMRNIFEQSFTLTFNRRESLYETNETLGFGNEADQGKFTQDDVYKNFEESLTIIKRELMGKTYLVSEPNKDFQWEMHNETKQIGRYTCYKATYTKEYEVEENVQNPDGGFEIKFIKKNITKTAWYTPEIPVMNGPDIYGGLPGLIMELTDDSNPLVIRCSEIIINSDKPVKIKRPSARRYYTDDEYREILKMD